MRKVSTTPICAWWKLLAVFYFGSSVLTKTPTTTTIITVEALSIVVAGGTGNVGKVLLPRLNDHQVTVLTRNAFLAATPTRVSTQYGHLGQYFLQQNPHVQLRTYDAGDLLDIVGDDWVGWQNDVLPTADIILHLTGGWTPQREMACERLVRESSTFGKGRGSAVLHVTVNPTDQDLALVAPTVPRNIKAQRIATCETMVQSNTLYHECLRVEANRINAFCDAILSVVDVWDQDQKPPKK
jgi:hypothetical protein